VKYGKGEHNRLFRERYGLHRLALHAARLSLKSPSNAELLCFEAPLPADLAAPLELLGAASVDI
jgi:tRNA pseudouridine65 synthase